MRHTYANETIEYEIIYKKRKTAGIYIDAYGRIEVRAPKETPEAQILQFIEKKWNWIQEKTKERKELTKEHREKIYQDGEVFLYLGNRYPLEIVEDSSIKKDQALIENGKLRVHVSRLDDEDIKQALKRFYYQQCKFLIEERIRQFQVHFRVKPRSIRITDNKNRWGSCDSSRQLTFNWKLAMAPTDVIDYIVVHEMCHMIHMNHDRSFWRLVGKLLPTYKEQETWLANSGWKMII